MPSPVPLDNLLGATYIGIIVSTAIYGVTCLQVYHYYMAYSKGDGRFLQSFVGVLFILDTFHAALVAMSYYHYTVTNFGDFEVLVQVTWSLGVTVGSFLSSLVQCFFARRVYILSAKRLLLPGVIVLLSVGQMVIGGIVYVDKVFKLTFFANSKPDLPYTLSALGLDFICDTLIATTMIYYLRKNRNSVMSTNRVVRLLIIYTMDTCLLTTMCTFACLIAWVVSTQTLIYAPFFFVLVRLYSCSLMTTLNNRHSLRQELRGNNVITLSAFKQSRTGPSTPTVDPAIIPVGHVYHGSTETGALSRAATNSTISRKLAGEVLDIA